MQLNSCPVFETAVLGSRNKQTNKKMNEPKEVAVEPKGHLNAFLFEKPT